MPYIIATFAVVLSFILGMGMGVTVSQRHNEREPACISLMNEAASCEFERVQSVEQLNDCRNRLHDVGLMASQCLLGDSN